MNGTFNRVLYILKYLKLVYVSNHYALKSNSKCIYYKERRKVDKRAKKKTERLWSEKRKRKYERLIEGA